MLTDLRLFALATLAVTLDLIARPVFWAIHRPPGGRRR